MWKVLHAGATVLVALFGFSAGAAAAAREGRTVPGAIDLAAAPAVAVAILAAGAGPLGWLLLPAAAVGAALPGAALDVVRRCPPEDGAGGPAGGRHARPVPDEGARFPRLRRFLHRTGEFQGRLILGMFYFAIVPPFAVIARLVQDPLSRAGEAPVWLARDGEGDEDTLESHGRPY